MLLAAATICLELTTVLETSNAHVQLLELGRQGLALEPTAMDARKKTRFALFFLVCFVWVGLFGLGLFCLFVFFGLVVFCFHFFCCLVGVGVFFVFKSLKRL